MVGQAYASVSSRAEVSLTPDQGGEVATQFGIVLQAAIRVPSSGSEESEEG